MPGRFTAGMGDTGDAAEQRHTLFIVWSHSKKGSSATDGGQSSQINCACVQVGGKTCRRSLCKRGVEGAAMEARRPGLEELLWPQQRRRSRCVFPALQMLNCLSINTTRWPFMLRRLSLVAECFWTRPTECSFL